MTSPMSIAFSSPALAAEGGPISLPGCHGLLRRTTRASSSTTELEYTATQVMRKPRVVRLRRSNPWHPASMPAQAQRRSLEDDS